jgi:hypothetical protein
VSAGTDPCPGPVCVTCADQAELATVRRLLDDRAVVTPVGEGPAAIVDVSLVAPVAPGDEVLVHAGVAISRVAAVEEVPR